VTFINLIPDDLGVQRLKSENTQPSAARAVTPVDPYPSQQANQPQPLPVPPRRRRKPRKGERRGGERRKRQEPVILDTRGSQDRRERADRREDEAEAGPPPHLDLFV
jgi:hypothetical protein